MNLNTYKGQLELPGALVRELRIINHRLLADFAEPFAYPAVGVLAGEIIHSELEFPESQDLVVRSLTQIIDKAGCRDAGRVDYLDVHFVEKPGAVRHVPGGAASLRHNAEHRRHQ